MTNWREGSQLRAPRYESDMVAEGRGRTSSKEQQAKVIISTTYWRPWHDLDVTEWIIQGRRLGTIGRGVAWWIGDWVNYGNTRFGQKYSRAARITGYDVQSLMNMSYVASRFDCSRRREKLSWSHHAEVAGLAIEYQEMWLDNAEQRSMSVHSLREVVRTWRANQRRAAGDTGQPQANTGHANDDPSPEPPDSEMVCPQCGYRMGAEVNHGKRQVHASD
jgi:hypothetical protein